LEPGHILKSSSCSSAPPLAFSLRFTLHPESTAPIEKGDHHSRNGALIIDSGRKFGVKENRVRYQHQKKRLSSQRQSQTSDLRLNRRNFAPSE
jgi:hypothetical protein